MPTTEAWLQGAIEDVTRASRPDVRPVLEALAQAAQSLRAADWNADATRDDARDSDSEGTGDRG